MSRLVKGGLAINLTVLGALVFAFPNLMVGPGKLIPGHRALETHCLACHAPFAGAASDRCVACHKPVDIGRRTTTGQAIAKPLTSSPFHQALIRADCVDCHSDHAGVRRFRQQGRFNHALLESATRERCQDCHRPPADALHQQITGSCGQCHGQGKWVPAMFDHSRYFELDRDHNDRCVTCHGGNDYRRYSCYGCHEHTTENIRREHIEEGIRDFDKCVECHRNANKHDIRGGNGSKEGAGERTRRRDKGDDDDDD
jgi:hypothetical protein